ncbi:MAG: CHAT domain-containing protein [Sphingosinicella sp.]
MMTAIATRPIAMAANKALIAALAALLAGLVPAASAQESVRFRDSFRIGSGGGVLCTAEAMLAGPALVDMFDRGYQVLCRDAAAPVGRLFALRGRGSDPVPRLEQRRAAEVVCAAEAGRTELAGVGAVESRDCRLRDADVAYQVYVHRSRGVIYFAEGLAGYQDALRLGLRSLVADRELEGEVSIATTGAGDPAAFARARAGLLDPQRALAEAYRRNNAGSYAESAEFFGQLTARDESAAARAEALVNEGLQKSNLGRFAAAEALFARAQSLAGGDPVTARRLRKYRVMHLLNQGLTAQALAELDRALPRPASSSQVRGLVIDRTTASQLSAESAGARGLMRIEGLTPQDKAQLLDGQALQLRGTVLRLTGRGGEAVAPLTQAMAELAAVRHGRIAATIWMRAQILEELASIAEASGDAAESERHRLDAIRLLEIDYPGSVALLGARARLAGYLARSGQQDRALSLFGQTISEVSEASSGSPSLRRLLEPYFELLVARGDDPQAVADLFAASQLLVRPGVAQTQAVLARELSGGSDEAARLFRQAVNLTRNIERARIELARIEASEEPAAQDEARAAVLRPALEALRRDQVATQARLADFPRYRVVAPSTITLAGLQQLLRPGEAYFKMMVAGDDAYGIHVSHDAARAFRIGASPAELEREVDALRATISAVENGQQLTYPFDVELAHRLYRQLFSPVHDQLAGIRHLVFEPDGAMLRLPPNLLIADPAGIASYRARVAAGGDEFDLRGIEWLGRRREVSTAVSARAFRDVRFAPRSRASSAYLGLGENAPPSLFFQPAGSGCRWPLSAWHRPIDAGELQVARNALGAGRPGEAEIVTGQAFNYSAIKARGDLERFRVIHFATHGLLTGPRPECSSQPALLTSFGGADSDGLLSFAEIFDLRLDADLIILSACDTAGGAGLSAAEAAGLSDSDDVALDGLVRAFVGAGGRLVIASHWPVPDDFDATGRLISGLFAAAPGTGTAAALRNTQLALMDRAETSHPYYWSGFAIVGDGAVPLARTSP